jgi:hypothetical protein
MLAESCNLWQLTIDRTLAAADLDLGLLQLVASRICFVIGDQNNNNNNNNEATLFGLDD